jgi:hypothetical protein
LSAAVATAAAIAVVLEAVMVAVVSAALRVFFRFGVFFRLVGLAVPCCAAPRRLHCHATLRSTSKWLRPERDKQMTSKQAGSSDNDAMVNRRVNVAPAEVVVRGVARGEARWSMRGMLAAGTSLPSMFTT